MISFSCCALKYRFVNARGWWYNTRTDALSCVCMQAEFVDSPNVIYNLKYQRLQVLAWFNSFMETVLGVSPLYGVVSRREWAPNGSIMRELAFGKDSSSSEKDSMGETRVLVVLQLSGGVWKLCLPATWVARLFRASLPTYCHWLWCTCQRLSLLFALLWMKMLIWFYLR